MAGEKGAPENEPALLVCPKCGTAAGASDAYCRQCGKKLKQGAKWYYDPLWIWMLGVFVLGALALPLAWWSPKMKPWNKTLFTVVITAYTALLFYACFVIVWFAWTRISEINDTGVLLGY